MKTSTHIRFVLAAIFATLACDGMLARVIDYQILFLVSVLLIMGTKVLTHPIPRKQSFGTFMVLGTFPAVMLTLALLPVFLHQPYVYEYHHKNVGIGGLLAVPTLSVLWMFFIFLRWQREKNKEGLNEN